MEITLIIHNIRSTYNVGAILRSAECLGVKKVYCSGYTPFPYANSILGTYRPELLPHIANKMHRQLEKTALRAETLIDAEWSEDIKKLLESLSKDHKIVGLENNLAAPTIKTTDKDLKTKLGDRVVLVLGEEVSGIPEDIRALCNCFLEIPMKGQKESFNVSVATAIAVYALTF